MNDVNEKRRARSMKELVGKMQAMYSGPVAPTEPYVPLPGDVIIAPFSKSGTTWLQQIFHTLRTRGDTDFDDISRVVPWIETAPRLGIDLNAPQRAMPRGYKSHATWESVPKGARYIVSIRDPRDVLVSMYRFMGGWFLEPGAISIEEFAIANMLHEPKKGYWGHLASWWPHRNDDNVLLMSYETMNSHREATVKRIAEFCGIDLDDELLQLTLNHSSFPFMLANKSKFDDLLMRELSERTANLPAGSDAAKVREGKVGGHRNLLSAKVLAELDRIWHEEIEARFGYRSYEEMVSVVS